MTDFENVVFEDGGIADQLQKLVVEAHHDGYEQALEELRQYRDNADEMHGVTPASQIADEVFMQGVAESDQQHKEAENPAGDDYAEAMALLEKQQKLINEQDQHMMEQVKVIKNYEDQIEELEAQLKLTVNTSHRYADQIRERDDMLQNSRLATQEVERGRDYWLGQQELKKQELLAAQERIVELNNENTELVQQLKDLQGRVKRTEDQKDQWAWQQRFEKIKSYREIADSAAEVFGDGNWTKAQAKRRVDRVVAKLPRVVQ